MAKENDSIVGKKFNMLTVKALTDKKKKYDKLYECECECGNIKYYTKAEIKQNKSCGCIRFQVKDLKGLKFGELTAVKHLRTEKKVAIWLCKCSCGNTVEATRQNLVNGDILSCGHLYEEKIPLHLKENREKMFVDGTNIAYLKSDKLSKANKSGIRGVSQKKNGKWLAQIVFKRKAYNLGTYEKKEDAIKARKEAEERLHNNFLKEKGLI